MHAEEALAMCRAMLENVTALRRRLQDDEDGRTEPLAAEMGGLAAGLGRIADHLDHGHA